MQKIIAFVAYYEILSDTLLDVNKSIFIWNETIGL